MHHVLEKSLLPKEAKDRVDELHRESVRNDGPFAREYGYLREEFWTTFAKLFEGRHGDEGIAWFRDKQPELFSLMMEATGRTPEMKAANR